MIRRANPAALAFLLLSAAVCTAYAAPSPGGVDEQSANVNTYLAIGAAVLLTGIIVYDIFADRSARADSIEAARADSVGPSIIDTGIDWEQVDYVEPRERVLAIAGFPSQMGAGYSQLFVSSLAGRLDDEYVQLLSQPVYLGTRSTPQDRLELAQDYFGADLFLDVLTEGDSLTISLLSNDPEIEWGATLPLTDSLAIIEAASGLSEYLSGI